MPRSGSLAWRPTQSEPILQVQVLAPARVRIAWLLWVRFSSPEGDHSEGLSPRQGVLLAVTKQGLRHAEMLKNSCVLIINLELRVIQRLVQHSLYDCVNTAPASHEATFRRRRWSSMAPSEPNSKKWKQNETNRPPYLQPYPATW